MPLVRPLPALALAALGSCAAGAPPRAAQDEAERVVELVLEAMRAGYERHDATAYLALWADDARLTGGRGELPGRYDFTLDRSSIEAAQSIRFCGTPPRYSFDFERAEGRVDGDEARLRTVTVLDFEGGFEREGEIYRLRRTPDGWRLFENRWWPIAEVVGDETLHFDAALWRELDARVARLEGAADPRERARALGAAYRFEECCSAWRRVTERDDARAADWAEYGRRALQVGEAGEALRAFRVALELDPAAPVPPHARAYLAASRP